jgi:hypothetical protein
MNWRILLWLFRHFIVLLVCLWLAMRSLLINIIGLECWLIRVWLCWIINRCKVIWEIIWSSCSIRWTMIGLERGLRRIMRRGWLVSNKIRWFISRCWGIRRAGWIDCLIGILLRWQVIWNSLLSICIDMRRGRRYCQGRSLRLIGCRRFSRWRFRGLVWLK